MFDQTVQTMYINIYIYIYMYIHVPDQPQKNHPVFLIIFHFISTEPSVVDFISAHQGDATCARAAAFVAHRTASWAGRVAAQRVWNTLVKTYRLVGGNTMFVGNLPRGFNLCVQKFGRKGMVCVSTLVWVYMFWCQSGLFFGWTDDGKIMMKICCSNERRE